ncbi:MAG: head-tail adaptor protein [Fimbriiglobus sp.]
MDTPEPGEMRDKIRIEAPDNQPNAAGQIVQTWAPIGDPYFAEIVDLSGSESLRARSVDATTTHRVRVYRVPAIEAAGPKARAVVITQGNKVLHLQSVRRLGNQFLEFDATGNPQ